METPVYAYFPGCSATSTGISFTKSMEYVNEALGIEFREIPDWCCCGANAGRITDRTLGLALPARSLAMAESMDGSPDIIAPCASCYNNLKRAHVAAKEDDAMRRRLEDLIELPFSAENEVMSLLELFARPEFSALVEQKATATLHGLKVACYYGCTLVRPAAICSFDDVENPRSMDSLMEAVGGLSVDWAFKTECCGASNQVAAPRESRALIERIFRNAADAGAEAIVTACPLCWLNLDLREDEVNRGFGTSYDMPVFYFTELLAAALGATPHEAGIDLHFKPAVETIERAVAGEGVVA